MDLVLHFDGAFLFWSLVRKPGFLGEVCKLLGVETLTMGRFNRINLFSLGYCSRLVLLYLRFVGFALGGGWDGELAFEFGGREECLQLIVVALRERFEFVVVA